MATDIAEALLDHYVKRDSTVSDAELDHYFDELPGIMKGISQTGIIIEFNETANANSVGVLEAQLISLDYKTINLRPDMELYCPLLYMRLKEAMAERKEDQQIFASNIVSLVKEEKRDIHVAQLMHLADVVSHVTFTRPSKKDMIIKFTNKGKWDSTEFIPAGATRFRFAAPIPILSFAERTTVVMSGDDEDIAAVTFHGVNLHIHHRNKLARQYLTRDELRRAILHDRQYIAEIKKCGCCH